MPSKIQCLDTPLVSFALDPELVQDTRSSPLSSCRRGHSTCQFIAPGCWRWHWKEQKVAVYLFIFKADKLWNIVYSNKNICWHCNIYLSNMMNVSVLFYYFPWLSIDTVFNFSKWPLWEIICVAALCSTGIYRNVYLRFVSSTLEIAL